MKNYIQEGDVLEVTAAAAIESGDLVKSGDFVGIAAKDAEIGELVAVNICGVYEVPKLAADNMTQGSKLYFDATNKRLTLDDNTGANALAGYAFKAAAASTTTVQVKLLY